MTSLYLASSSPRRAELLRQIGIDFVVMPSDIDESVLPGEAAAEYVGRLAQQKAAVCLDRLRAGQAALLPVLAADTAVCVQGEILGKPQDDADAHRMLRLMSGGWHEVHTGVAVAGATGIEVTVSTTRVRMAALSDAAIWAYIASGESHGKAGAYGIQGFAATFIQRIDGSYTGVMGLPLYETALLLQQASIPVLSA